MGWHAALAIPAAVLLGACSTVWGFDDLVAGDGGSFDASVESSGGSGSSSGSGSGGSSGSGSGSSSGADSGSSSGGGSGSSSGGSSGGVDAGKDGAADAGSSSGTDSGSGSSSGSSSGADSGSDGGAVGPPSCAPAGAGMTNCGSGSTSCCTSLEVMGSTYSRTYTNSGSGPTGTGDPASVSNVRLDAYEVTVGRFRQFVAAWNGGSGWTPPAGSGKHTHLNGGQGLANSGSAGTNETGWVTSDNSNVAPTTSNLIAGCDAPSYATWTAVADSQENLPINCVNWWESYAFCIWDGGFLPSEAEWEYAAAGGSQEREYPWGTMAPGTACPGTGCQYAIYGCYYPGGSGTCTSVVNLAPVGTATLGAGLWGQVDLAGNVWEWNLDWYAPYVDPCADCAYLAAASSRVIRGGSFIRTASLLLPPVRGYGTPSARSYDLGLRCARTP